MKSVAARLSQRAKVFAQKRPLLRDTREVGDLAVKEEQYSAEILRAHEHLLLLITEGISQAGEAEPTLPTIIFWYPQLRHLAGHFQA